MWRVAPSARGRIRNAESALRTDDLAPAKTNDGTSFARTKVEVCVAKKATRRSTSKRELIDTGRNKMYAKRTAGGQFKEMDDVGRSLSADRRRKAKTSVASGQGDQGDRKRKASKKK
jgi:hypothetical protein